MPVRCLETFAQRAQAELVRFAGIGTATTRSIVTNADLKPSVRPARHTDTLSASRALIRDDPRVDLERVRCPTLLLWGARDHQLPIGDAFDYARRLHAPLRTIADCGHLLIGERPDACLDAILGFLDRLEAGDSTAATVGQR